VRAAADETLVSVLDKTAAPAAAGQKDEADPEEKPEKAATGAPHVLITPTPDGRLTFLQCAAHVIRRCRAVTKLRPQRRPGPGRERHHDPA
jgi:hypothetical protein